MARRVDPIKECIRKCSFCLSCVRCPCITDCGSVHCIEFRGTPDPIRGDELNKRVRDAAKEALDAIFDSQMPVTTSAVAAANRIQGMGNDYVPDAKPKESSGIISSLVTGIQNTILKDSSEGSYVGNHGATGSFQQNSRYSGPGGSGHEGSGKYSGSSSSSSSSGMVGIGNPNFRDARGEKSWMQKASEAVSGVTGSTPSSAPVRSGTGPSDYNYATNRGSNAYGMNDPGYNPRPMNALGANSNVNWTPSGMTTGGAVAAPSTGVASYGRAGAAATDGTYEKAMIDALCEPGGLKPVPPEDKLQEFLMAAPTLSVDVVGNCLADNLQSENWQARTKTLLVIAALAKASSCQAHVEWWQSNASEINALLQDSKANVRTQTVKTLKALGVTVAVGAEEAPSGSRSPLPGSQPIAAGGVTSLLDDFDEPTPVTGSSSPVPASYMAPPVAQFTSTPTTTTTNSFFGDMQVNHASPAPVAAAPGGGLSMFDGLAVGSSMASPMAPPAAPAMQPTGGASSAFDFLDMGASASAPTMVPSVAVPPPAPVPTNTSSFSVFDALDNTPLVQGGAAPLTPSYPGAMTPASAVSAPGPATGSETSGFSFFAASAAPSNPADAISSVFSAPPGDKSKEDAANASFAALSASFGLVPSSSSASQKSNGAAAGVPMVAAAAAAGRPMYAPAPTGMGMAAPYGSTGVPQYGAVPGNGYGAPVYGAPAAPMYGYNPNVSPLAPSMLAHNAPRKSIPTADAAAGNSGFSFMGSSGAPAAGNNGGRGPAATNSNADSFDFVSQAMKGNMK